MIRTRVQLTGEQDHALEDLAGQQRVSKPALVREAVDLLLRQHREPTLEEKWDRAMQAVGAFHGDGANVAVEHDKYLAEAYADWQHHDEPRR